MSQFLNYVLCLEPVNFGLNIGGLAIRNGRVVRTTREIGSASARNIYDTCDHSIARMLELGRISTGSPRSWEAFRNWGGFPKGFQGVREDFGIGEDFQIDFNELERILALDFHGDFKEL